MGDILMSDREVDRHVWFKKWQNGDCNLVSVSQQIGVGYRQTLRLAKRFQQEGKKGLISKKRGRKSNRVMLKTKKDKILKLIREKYTDFGPTFAVEKLKEEHKISVSRETVRQLMTEAGLWTVKRKKAPRAYQRRRRRSQVGEMAQIDGSPHLWFEERGPVCTLLLSVDDATSKVMAGMFSATETTEAYFHLIDQHIRRYGKPLCYYSDKHSIFRVNQAGGNYQPTQFSRAMQELNIELINAHSPQAKGRVERANRTLQDRLVKEMRLRQISSIEEGNAFLPKFIEAYNKKFGKLAADPVDAHTPLDKSVDLNQILCKKSTRKLSKNLELCYNNAIYQIDAPSRTHRLRGAAVTVIESMDGRQWVECRGESLPFRKYGELNLQPSIVGHKELAARRNQAA